MEKRNVISYKYYYTSSYFSDFKSLITGNLYRFTEIVLYFDLYV